MDTPDPDLWLGNLLLVLVLSEAVVNICARYSTSPLFLNMASVEANLARARETGTKHYFNFPLNRGGYHDQEFFSAEAGELVAAVLGDSFGFGIVPYAYNFVTVAEREVQTVLSNRYQRVALHNFGLPSIGMDEYAHLLETEALATNPLAVLLCVYVGNDISESRPKGWPYYKFQSWWVWMVVERLLLISGEQVATGSRPPPPSMLPEPTLPDYIQDSAKEPPKLSEEAFLRIEAQHMEILGEGDRQVEENYRFFFKSLDRIRRRAGERLLLVLIPDEFQVNDDLYRRLLSRKGVSRGLNREYPQQRIRAYCGEHDIPLLDLLPPLREAERSGRTYHRRDTHWNARGNRVAGLEMASFLLQEIPR